MFIYLIIILLLILLFLFREYFFSFLTFISLRLEGKEPDFQILNSLRDDLIHERKKKIASLEMTLSIWEKGEKIPTHLSYFKDLIGQLKALLKDQRRNLLLISSPLVYVKLNYLIEGVRKNLTRIDKDKEKIIELKNKLDIFSEELERVLDKATQRFTFSLNEVIKEAVKIVRTEKDRILKEKEITIEERYEDIGEKFRLPYKSYKDWQKLISNLIRNGVEAVEQKLQPKSLSPLATGYSLLGGVVKVFVQGVGEEATVVVEDNGIGMDEKTKESFYKRGFTQGKDSGLGLGITEETVEFINRYGSWEMDSKINEGTRIEIRIDKEKARRQDLTIENRSALVIKLKSRRVIFALAGVMIVVIGLGLYFQLNKYARFWEDWNPAYAEANGNMLIVRNKSNRNLWDKLLPGIVLDTSHIALSELNGDGKMEIVVGITYTEKRTGEIICFNYKKEKLWEFPLGESGIYSIGEKLNNNYFTPMAIRTEDLDGDSKKEIIVNSTHCQWFPSQLAVLDHKGNKISEYWHPGRINCLYCLDFDGDGKKEIILGGTNNRMGWKGFISVLDPEKASGQAMPYIAKKKIKKAEEKWYVIFPRIKKRIPNESQWELYKSGVNDIAILLNGNEITAGLGDGRAYHLSLNFEFGYVYPAVGQFERWVKENTFPYNLTGEDSISWGNIEAWKDGVKIK